MGIGDGSVLGATKILDHGPDSDRWTLVLVAEGYRAAEIEKFATDAQSFVATLLGTAPFDRLQAALNVYRLDVASTDSGADDPTACCGTGSVAATYFDASFCNSGARRLLVVDTATVMSTVGADVPAWNMIMVLVNSKVYGGSGGAVAVFSMAAGAAEIGLHEMGHTAFGLADEYEYYLECGRDVGRDRHPTVEPDFPNVTIDSNRATIKWRDLVLAGTPMPTTSNTDCSICDPQSNPRAPDTVGAYEGANYYHCGVFRPQFDCRMRTVDRCSPRPFCAVCRRRITETLTPLLPSKTIVKELKEIKEFKEIKLEKIEIKEVFKEIKLEKLEVEVSNPALGNPMPDAGTQSGDPVDIGQRLDRLEDTVARIAHFIEREQRPDSSRGALQNEPPRE
ncbi:M64 family metallopeptidase [Nocardia sp. NPDC004654]|uniref:M64 family metallopeptidase n=1 Tax=Nocardia sp. NPDC004654 TaxID=3154776 RepID=UPI0033A4A651